MSTQPDWERISVRIPPDMDSDLDKAQARYYGTKSDFVRHAIADRLWWFHQAWASNPTVDPHLAARVQILHEDGSVTDVAPLSFLAHHTISDFNRVPEGPQEPGW